MALVTAGLRARYAEWRAGAILAACAGWRAARARWGDRFVIGGWRPAGAAVVGVAPRGGSSGVRLDAVHRAAAAVTPMMRDAAVRLAEMGANSHPVVGAEVTGVAKWPASVVTEVWKKPIPTRAFDWSATLEGYEPGDPIGHGSTQSMALMDLSRQVFEREQDGKPQVRRPAPGDA